MRFLKILKREECTTKNYKIKAIIIIRMVLNNILIKIMNFTIKILVKIKDNNNIKDQINLISKVIMNQNMILMKK